MNVRGRIHLAVCLGTGLMWSGCGASQNQATSAPGYEVWVVDQSDTRGLDHGGTLYVFAGADLRGEAASSAKPAAVVDLGGQTAALCRDRTGANPVRPHMVLFNREQTHATLAFVASGHVVVFDAATRTPLECLRTTQAPTGRQAHAAFPAPDGSYILVANQNGKRLERIDANFATNTFTHNETATLDLAACTTPSGAPCQAPNVRPDNAPICPVVSEASDLAFVTLRGGGMLVVDPRPEPMRIVAEYDMATVKGNGCGGAQVRGQMYVNSGGRPGRMEHLHLYGFDVYRFPLEAFGAASGALAPNTPAPDLAESAPSGDLVFVAFRGPTPLSGDPHIATGSTPGLGILEVLEGGRNGRLVGLVRLTNVGDEGVERADPHGLRVRRLP